MLEIAKEIYGAILKRRFGGNDGQPATLATGARTWLTETTCALMVITYLAVLIGGDAGRIAWMLHQSADEIWMGKYWALITSAFVHQHLWHLALNLGAFWTVARPVERVIGPWLVLLIIFSAFVSSVAQLAVSGETGVGFSGVLFAVFGFGWLAQKKYPSLRSTFSPKNVAFVITFLVGSILLLRHEVANGAHVGGFAFGMVVAEAFSTGRMPRLAKVGAAALVIAASVVALCCPWSATWWAITGYRVHLRGDYAVAAEFYQQSLQLEPGQLGILVNLVWAQTAAGDLASARSALDAIRRVDPSRADELEAKLNANRRDAAP